MLPTQQINQQTRRNGLIVSIIIFMTCAAIIIASQQPLLLTVILILPALALSYLSFWVIRKQYNNRMLAINTPFPDNWEKVLRRRVDYFNRLSKDERIRFRQMLQVFLSETEIIDAGAGVDEELKVLVGASAIIPIFGFPNWEYGMLQQIIIRPEPFNANFDPYSGQPLYASGMVGDKGIFSGTLILSKPDLLRDFVLKHDGHNVGIHEFSHLIDKASGNIDGVPISLPRESFRPWIKLVQQILKEEGRNKKNRDIPAYGFTNEEEFFAVISEYFFEKPEQMQKKHPELYDILEKIFRQDTSALLKKTLTQSVRGLYRS